jgi:hypothetical protein
MTVAVAPQSIPRVSRNLDSAKEGLLAASVMYCKCLDAGYDADASGVTAELLVAAWNYHLAFCAQQTTPALLFREMDFHEFARLQGWNFDAFPEPERTFFDSLMEAVKAALPGLLNSLPTMSGGGAAARGSVAADPSQMERDAFGPLMEGVQRLRAAVAADDLDAAEVARAMRDAITWAKTKNLDVPVIRELVDGDVYPESIAMLVNLVLTWPHSGEISEGFLAEVVVELTKLLDADDDDTEDNAR